MKSVSLAWWSPGRSVLTSRKAIVPLGATLAVSDLEPAAPASTKTPAAVTRDTHSTTAPATPQRSFRGRGATANGKTPGAQPSPIGTTVACGTAPAEAAL